MEFSFAPMEGVTSHLFRLIHRELFPGADRYYAPFLAPDGEGRCRTGAFRDILPENNPGFLPVPQILCNRPEPFLLLAEQLADMGYEEINLNIGCPSATVAAKHKGAGMLADLDSLARCLDGIFAASPLPVSIKTRLGLKSSEEFPAILELYKRYPIRRLIVHARDRAGMYKSAPDLEMFALALRECRAPVCYNGNLFSVADLDALQSAFPQLEAVMLGRGAVANPALFRQMRGGAALTQEELLRFLERLLAAFLDEGLPPPYALARLKELWHYLICLFPDSQRLGKAIWKARTLDDYRAALEVLLASGRFSPEAAFTQD